MFVGVDQHMLDEHLVLDGLALGQGDRQRDHEGTVALREVGDRAHPLRLVPDRVTDARIRAVGRDPDLALAAGNFGSGEGRRTHPVAGRRDDQDRRRRRQRRQDVGHLAPRVLGLVRTAGERVDREVLVARDLAAHSLETFDAPARPRVVDVGDRREVERDVRVVRAVELWPWRSRQPLAGDEAGLPVVGPHERLLAGLLGRVDGHRRQPAVGLAHGGRGVGEELPIDHRLELQGRQRAGTGQRLLRLERAVAFGQDDAGLGCLGSDALGDQEDEWVAVTTRDVADPKVSRPTRPVPPPQAATDATNATTAMPYARGSTHRRQYPPASPARPGVVACEPIRARDAENDTTRPTAVC